MLIIFILFPIVYNNGFPNIISDSLLLTGDEKPLKYGVDTTNHWWAITEPFSNRYRLIVDGIKSDVFNKIEQLKFSPDGNSWACLVNDNVGWYLLTNEKKISMGSGKPAYFTFSSNSEILAYSFFDNDYGTIVCGKRKISVFQPRGRFYISYGGERLAYIGKRSGRFVLNIEGFETTQYDEIKPIGFWYDGTFIYAARNNTLWQVYKNEKQITEPFIKINDIAINSNGTVAAVLATKTANNCVGILISDDYYEPLISKVYDEVKELALHPYLAMFAYKAKWGGQNFVVFNSTEYFSSDSTSKPLFTYDGSELYFIGCNIDCFINVNGKNFSIAADIDFKQQFAKCPQNNSLAYSTSSSLIIRLLDNGELIAGKMFDNISFPIYNRYTGEYQALGIMGNRLYLQRYKN